MSEKILPKLWAGGFVYHPFKKKVLLHLRDHNTEYSPGKLAFFGGLREGSESARQCFCREMEEETGLLLHPKFISKLTEYTLLKSGTLRSVYYVILPIQLDDLHIMEGAGARWLSFEALDPEKCTKSCYQDLQLFREILQIKK